MRQNKWLKRIVIFAVAAILLFSMAPSAFAAEYRTLHYGDSGNEVTTLQQALYEKGYLSVSPTGYYGWMTESAVMAFQKDAGLIVDGIAGSNTQTKLYTGNESASTLLKLGSTGSKVTTLQQRLHQLGYLDYSGATGYYGNVTKTAVVRFQQNHGLVADGTAGPATTAALYASSAKSLVLKIGSSGEAVYSLQQRLSALGFYTYSITGYYGNITKDAVIRFQKACGLSADGIAGPATRIKLFSNNACTATPTSAGKIADIAVAQVGKPYVLGSEGPSSFDCSGLAHYAINGTGYNVPRYSASVYSEYSAWAKITGTSSLKKGDLIFFRSDTSSYIGHMGIYIGNNEFVHASSGQGKVMISTLTNSYWARNYMHARRVS